jgi:hypothetical protein
MPITTLNPKYGVGEVAASEGDGVHKSGAKGQWAILRWFHWLQVCKADMRKLERHSEL